MVEKTGQMGVPVTVLDGEAVVGFDRERLEKIIAASGARPSFGLKIADASGITRKEGGVPVFGAYVGDVRPSSTASQIGVKPGDIITEFNMQPVHNAHDLEDALLKMAPNARVQMVISREGRTLAVEGVYR